jgi:hypothetical protein
LVFRLAELLPFRWWNVWAMFMIAIAPVVIWMAVPAAFLPVAVLTLVVIYAVQFRNAARRLSLLKWGQPVTVTGSSVISSGTYYSGTTYNNMIVPVARGWTVQRSLYSGPKVKTAVRYTLGGYQGELVVGGREYIDGVILADQRNPARALCVTSFPYDLDRDAEGNWVGKLRTAQMIGMFAWLIIIVGWLALATFISTPFGSGGSGGGGSSTSAGSGPASSTTSTAPAGPTAVAGSAPSTGGQPTSAPGGVLSVSGIGESKTIACDDSDVTVSGISDIVTITGHCESLVVSGTSNQITVDAVDTITTSGISNSVIFHSGSPQIDNGGTSNTISQG